jgi:hypothetical protein
MALSKGTGPIIQKGPAGMERGQYPQPGAFRCQLSYSDHRITPADQGVFVSARGPEEREAEQERHKEFWFPPRVLPGPVLGRKLSAKIVASN